MLQFGIAKELGMSLSDVRKMTLEEVIGWSAYFQVLNEDQEKEMEKIRRRRWNKKKIKSLWLLVTQKLMLLLMA